MNAAGEEPLRLLILYEALSPDFAGGIETRNRELACALAAQGHRVTLAGFGESGAAEEPEGVRRLSLGSPASLYDRRGRRSLSGTLRFASRLSRLDLRQFDVVETASMPFTHLPRLASRCAAAGRPLIVTWYEFWGGYWRTYLGAWRAPFFRWAERRAALLGDCALASSELTRARLAAVRGFRKLELLPCGLDLSTLRAEAAEPAAGGAPLVFAGRLLAHKRIDLLLDAVAQLAAAGHPPPLLTLIGDGPALAPLTAHSRRLGLEDHVRFTGRLLRTAEVRRLIAAARVAVQPSAREGFGLFPLEAMALSLPVVYCRSTDSSVGELVRDGEEGIAVDADPGSLARALAALLADEPLRARLGMAAARRAEAFDLRRVSSRFAATCRELSTGERRRA